VAYDCFGRALLRPAEYVVSVPPAIGESSPPVMLLLRYRETIEFPRPRDTAGVCLTCGDAYPPETPNFIWKASSLVTSSDGVPVARVTYKDSEAFLDTQFTPASSRPLAKPYLANGSTIPGRTPSVAALAPGGKGGLLVHTGASLAPVRLLIGQACRKHSVFWSEAIKAPGEKVVWHRLQGIETALASDAHIQFFRYASNSEADAPAPPALGPGVVNPSADPKWQAAPPDIADFFIGGAPTLYLWVGAHFSGDGLASPTISQMRVEFDHQTYLAYLPAIYQKPGVCAGFLLRLLSLFESFYGETESKIRRLPALFDPAATPPEYLPWLAGVQVYRGQLNCPEKPDEVTAVLEQEKPAHTQYHLCVLEPRMRVGFQARVGIDAIVGGAPPSLRLGETSTLCADASFAGPAAARVGAGIRLGVSTWVG